MLQGAPTLGIIMVYNIDILQVRSNSRRSLSQIQMWKLMTEIWRLKQKCGGLKQKCRALLLTLYVVLTHIDKFPFLTR